MCSREERPTGFKIVIYVDNRGGMASQNLGLCHKWFSNTVSTSLILVWTVCKAVVQFFVSNYVLSVYSHQAQPCDQCHFPFLVPQFPSAHGIYHVGLGPTAGSANERNPFRLQLELDEVTPPGAAGVHQGSL